MSVKIMAAVWELDLPQNEKLILLALADHADDHGFCFPSVARLAWKSGYSVRQAQEILKRLGKRSVLEVVGNQQGGRGRTTRYRVCPEKGAKIAPFSKSEGCGPARERVQSDAERVRPRARKGAVATAPESSVTVREPSENHHAARAKERPLPVDDSDPRDLFEPLKAEFAWLTPRRFDFGVSRVRARAKTRPRSRLFWEKSLRRFLEDFIPETETFLTEQAAELLAQGGPLPAIAEELKCRAALHELGYSSGLISQVIERAQERVEKQRGLRIELTTGALDPHRVTAPGASR